MTSINRPAIRVSNPAELLALVPYLIGFQPASSLVVLAVAGGKIVVTARMNLPTGPDTVPQLRAALDTLTATMPRTAPPTHCSSATAPRHRSPWPSRPSQRHCTPSRCPSAISCSRPMR
jgi:hypothetical protein